MAAAASVASFALASAGAGLSHYSDDYRYIRDDRPRKKSTHKRKHKGSKAAKKASRQPKRK
jgi:hypothetical protein